ncbi:hypothetical protein LHL20_19890 [Alteromonas sp. McT4-15]|uniref:hypothetical protein n=1 Tax=Alteromonas sp. McT4-15 TaxID=2881256 RepID=UPI001CF8F78C|nr:hypothetical protein [Alteromonas sp. McT4-15]MCB4438496.1 hypothetical protein [Alteromonas sp. McT4-15]
MIFYHFLQNIYRKNALQFRVIIFLIATNICALFISHVIDSNNKGLFSNKESFNSIIFNGSSIEKSKLLSLISTLEREQGSITLAKKSLISFTINRLHVLNALYFSNEIAFKENITSCKTSNCIYFRKDIHQKLAKEVIKNEVISIAEKKYYYNGSFGSDNDKSLPEAIIISDYSAIVEESEVESLSIIIKAKRDLSANQDRIIGKIGAFIPTEDFLVTEGIYYSSLEYKFDKKVNVFDKSIQRFFYGLLVLESLIFSYIVYTSFRRDIGIISKLGWTSKTLAQFIATASLFTASKLFKYSIIVGLLFYLGLTFFSYRFSINLSGISVYPYLYKQFFFTIPFIIIVITTVFLFSAVFFTSSMTRYRVTAKIINEFKFGIYVTLSVSIVTLLLLSTYSTLRDFDFLKDRLFNENIENIAIIDLNNNSFNFESTGNIVLSKSVAPITTVLDRLVEKNAIEDYSMSSMFPYLTRDILSPFVLDGKKIDVRMNAIYGDYFKILTNSDNYDKVVKNSDVRFDVNASPQLQRLINQSATQKLYMEYITLDEDKGTTNRQKYLMHINAIEAEFPYAGLLDDTDLVAYQKLKSISQLEFIAINTTANNLSLVVEQIKSVLPPELKIANIINYTDYKNREIINQLFYLFFLFLLSGFLIFLAVFGCYAAAESTLNFYKSNINTLLSIGASEGQTLWYLVGRIASATFACLGASIFIVYRLNLWPSLRSYCFAFLAVVSVILILILFMFLRKIRVFLNHGCSNSAAL